MQTLTGLLDIASPRILQPVPGGNDIGSKIRAARKEKDWNQKQLAEAVGVPQSRMSDWERGRFRPERDNLARIARALGKTIEHFLADASDLPSHTGTGQKPAPKAGDNDASQTDPRVLQARITALEDELAATKSVLGLFTKAAADARKRLGGETGTPSNIRPGGRRRHRSVR